jgi:hypothetical protein
LILEFGNALQRRASQSLGVTRDVTLTLALQSGYSTIERGNELAQIAEKGLV